MSNYDEQLIKQYIQESKTIADVLRKLGLDPRGANYRLVHEVIKKLSIDTSHFLGQAHCRGSTKLTLPWEEVLVEQSSVKITLSRKRRLITDGLLTAECYMCHLKEWMNKPLALQIDHINGRNHDNRIENLRLLCPNCHSQTDTFAGKNISKKTAQQGKVKIESFCECGNTKSLHSKLCLQCFNRNKTDAFTKIVWPAHDMLIARINSSNMSQVARELGVSPSAIKKRLKTRGLLALLVKG